MSSGTTPAHTVAPNLELDEVMAEIEKGQQLAGHFPDDVALNRARRILTGRLTEQQAWTEIDAEYPLG